MEKELIADVEWVEYFDEETQSPYYYNKETKQTQYDLPEEYSKWKEDEIEKYLKTTKWRMRKDDKRNKFFYFNKETSKTQWEVPDDVKKFEEFLKEVNVERTVLPPTEDVNNEGLSNREGTPENWSPASKGWGSEEENEDTSFVQREISVESAADFASWKEGDTTDSKEELDKERSDLESRLIARDAIMEINIKERVIDRYLQITPEATPLDVIQKLSQGYCGYAQMTHLVCICMQIATGTGEGGKVTFDADAMIAKDLSNLIKRKFNKVLCCVV